MKKSKLNLYEAFAGIGSQYLALKRLQNIKFNVNLVGISEWDPFALSNYWDLHFFQETLVNFQNEDLEQLVNEKTFSLDSKKPSNKINFLKYKDTFLKVKNLSEKIKLDTDIQKVKGQDIIDLDVDIFTYSFPCQDLSTAGKGLGLDKESNTRSGLLWEVERILEEIILINKSKLPKYLLLENVSNLFNKKYLDYYILWKSFLNKIGYTTFDGVLDARDFGIPQSRKRAFAISVLNYKGKKNPNTKLLDFLQKTETKSLKNFLKIKYSDKKQLEEALEHSPNSTLSREKMWKESEVRLVQYHNDKIEYKNYARTLTTSQDIKESWSLNRKCVNECKKDC